MHVNNVGYPANGVVGAESDGGTPVTVSLSVDAAPGAVFRMTGVTSAKSNPYASLSASVIGDYYGMDGLTDDTRVFIAASDGHFGFSFSTSGSPPNFSTEARFTFDLEIETPSGSGVFVPVTPENAIIVFDDGDGFAESDLAPPDVVCFWTEEFNARQVCDYAPPPDPDSGSWVSGEWGWEDSYYGEPVTFPFAYYGYERLEPTGVIVPAGFKYTKARISLHVTSDVPDAQLRIYVHAGEEFFISLVDGELTLVDYEVDISASVGSGKTLMVTPTYNYGDAGTIDITKLEFYSEPV